MDSSRCTLSPGKSNIIDALLFALSDVVSASKKLLNDQAEDVNSGYVEVVLADPRGELPLAGGFAETSVTKGDLEQKNVLGKKDSILDDEDLEDFISDLNGAGTGAVEVDSSSSSDAGKNTTSSQTVIVRRYITHRNFLLNGKPVPKHEVFSMLDAVGMGSGYDNLPHWVVRQGKVAEVARMSDKRRNALVLELAGGLVFEARRDATRKKLAEAKEGRERVG